MERPRISINEVRKQRAGETMKNILELKGLWNLLTTDEQTKLVVLFTDQIDHCTQEEEENWIISAAQGMIDLRP